MHWSTGANSAAWLVPYACAQQYHPGSGSHEQLFRPYWGSSAWHGRRTMSGGKPVYQRPFTAKASAKHSFKHQLVGNRKTHHAYGDGIRKIGLCASQNFEATKCDPPQDFNHFCDDTKMTHSHDTLSMLKTVIYAYFSSKTKDTVLPCCLCFPTCLTRKGCILDTLAWCGQALVWVLDTVVWHGKAFISWHGSSWLSLTL